MSRANPNPTCHECGKPTRTQDYYRTGVNGRKLGSSWVTSCGNVNCLNCSREGAISGGGPTMKSARDDYRAQAAALAGGGV